MPERRPRGTDSSELAAAESVGWSPQLPLLFGVIALASLVVIPLVVDGHVQTQRLVMEEIGDPALRHATTVQLAMATQMAALRGFVITGDDQFVDSYSAVLRQEVAATERLRALVAELDPRLLARLDTLEAAAARWRAPHDDILTRRITAVQYLDFAMEQQVAYLRALDAAAELEAGIAGSLSRLRDASRRAEALALWVTLAMVVLALAAILVLLRVGRRLGRRAREELELRHAALALTSAVGVEEVLGRIVGSAVEHTAGDCSYVERVLPGGAEVELVAAAGECAPPVGLRVPYPGSLSEVAISSGEAELLEDIAAESRPISQFLAQYCGHCAAIIVPLVSEEEALGALVILRHGARSFRREHTLQPRILGALAALAFRRAVLLRQAEEGREAVERLMAGRSRLMRGLSHDLKNPLGAADGYAQLLADGVLGELGDRQLESVGRIRGLIREAIDLLDELHEFARAERGMLELRSVPTDLAALVRDTAETYEARAEVASLELVIHEPATDLPVIETDPARVRQVVSNLLSNAIKYTPEGGRVEVGVRRGTENEGPERGRWLVIEVADTGPGISAEEQERLFTEFARVGAGEQAGAGLGLAISRSVAHLLGGDLTLRSEVGRGSTFSVWVPVAGHDADGPPMRSWP